LIPATVTNIGEFAFDGCESLTNVVLPDSIIRFRPKNAPFEIPRSARGVVGHRERVIHIGAPGKSLRGKF
jgi:hypothetical protein